jgi:pyruvate-ferredoxin/flavodoxin oxidoreductase
MAIPRSEAPPRGTTEVARGPRRGTVAIHHAIDAAIKTELLCAKGIWAPRAAIGSAAPNAFGDEPRHLGEDPHQAHEALAACERIAEAGGRAAAFVGLAALVGARRSLIGLVERRRPIVIHAVIAPRGEGVDAAAHGDLHALGDVGVAILVARDAQDAADLVLVAHRAAEDAETPVVVIHDGWPASWACDRIVLPDGPLVRGVLEPAPAPLAPAGEESVLAHRRAAARIPFALSSAMRAFERHAARPIHAVEAFQGAAAEVVLVAAGAVAETAHAVVERMQAASGEPRIGVVQVVTLRPFPGPQLVKAIGRARAVAVIERADEPLRQSNPLAVELKAAFVDALTWAPGYPGVGRIPPIFAACIDPADSEASPIEILAVIDQMLQGEQSARNFRIGRGARALAQLESNRLETDGALSLRWTGDPRPVFEILVDFYGGHLRATPRAPKGEPIHDVILARSPVRAHHGATELDLVVVHAIKPPVAADDLASVSAVREGGVVLVVGEGAPEGIAAHLPNEILAEARARRARIFVTSAPTAVSDRAAALCGAILRAVPPPGLDRAQILADVERALRANRPSSSEAELRSSLDAIARGLEATSELPVTPFARA